MFGFWEAVAIVAAAFALGWITGRMGRAAPADHAPATDSQKRYIRALCRRLDQPAPAALDAMTLDNASDTIDSLLLELDSERV